MLLSQAFKPQPRQGQTRFPGAPELSHFTRTLSVFLGMSFFLFACHRQFAVTVNSTSVYTPQRASNTAQVTDPDLQGCINLSLRQQNNSATALMSLSCANAEVDDLRGLEDYPTLRFLDLGDNNIADLTPLERLPQLSGLNLPNNALTDIAPLLEISSLRAVNLTGNERIPCDQLRILQQRLGNGLTAPAACIP